MDTYPRQLTDAGSHKRISNSRGQGRGSNYLPWLTVRDVPSIGLSFRIKKWKSHRIHHLLSQLEANYFYTLEWSLMVTDVREQYPLLPLSETLQIASLKGISHPTSPKTNQPIVMTTDFLITISQGMGVAEVARTIKPKQKLNSQRTREKLEIERCYWAKRNINWGIVTEQEIPTVLAANIKWLHPFFDSQFLNLPQEKLPLVKTLLTQLVQFTDTNLAQIATDCDEQLHLPPGSSLSVARHLIATRQWLVDMNQPIEPREKLTLIAVNREGTN